MLSALCILELSPKNSSKKLTFSNKLCLTLVFHWLKDKFVLREGGVFIDFLSSPIKSHKMPSDFMSRVEFEVY